MKRSYVASREAVEVRAWKMNRVFDLAQAGKSRAEIIAETGLIPDRVDRYLSGLKRGVVPWKRGMFDMAGRSRRERLAAEKRARAVQLRNSGLTLREIGDRLDVSEGAGSQWLSKISSERGTDRANLGRHRVSAAQFDAVVARGFRRLNVYKLLREGKKSSEIAAQLEVMVATINKDVRIIGDVLGEERLERLLAPQRQRIDQEMHRRKPVPELRPHQERFRTETVMPLVNEAIGIYIPRYSVDSGLLEEIRGDAELLSYRITLAYFEKQRSREATNLQAFVRKRVNGAFLDARRRQVADGLARSSTAIRRLFSFLRRVNEGLPPELAAQKAHLTLEEALALKVEFEAFSSQTSIEEGTRLPRQ